MRAALYTVLGLIVAVALGTLLNEPHARNSTTTMILMGWTTFLPSRLPRATFNGSAIAWMLCCLVLVTGLAHNFCSWLRRSSGAAEPWRLNWTLTGVSVVILLFLAGMAVTGIAHQSAWLATEPRTFLARPLTSPQVTDGLRAILRAQKEFRSEDRDENGMRDYWRQDIAGLHGLIVRGQPIKLIGLSDAMADYRPRTDLGDLALGNKLPMARAGYYFKALKFEGESDFALHPDRFAACAFPASMSSGNAIFIISDAGILYVNHYDFKPLEVFPSDPEKAGWYRVE